ncbi:hypothetical protein E2C01_021005 [Portunus trituberculatus]|uniref:Apple domain-containing protein n=1 Tax=Portunus trituberculatus TaxID=210409 RepID=A0A5B7E1L2_PORTR|nr:hypothetical protein [Portunus trituberculatus]
MAVTRLFLAVALVVYHCRGQLSGKVYRRLPNYRLEQVTVLRETAISSMMKCASLCHASYCNAYIMNKSVTTQPRCMVVTYSLTPYLISDHSYDLYIMADAPLPLKTNLDGYFGTWQSPLLCLVGYYVYGYRLWVSAVALSRRKRQT